MDDSGNDFNNLVLHILKETSAYDVGHFIVQGRMLDRDTTEDRVVNDPQEAVSLAIYFIFKDIVFGDMNEPVHH